MIKAPPNVQTDTFDTSLIFAGAIFFAVLCVFFAVLAVRELTMRRKEIRRRTMMAREAVFAGKADEQLTEDTLLTLHDATDVTATLAAIDRGTDARNGQPLSKTRIQLVKAGFFGKYAEHYFQAARLIGAIGAPIAFLVVMRALLPDVQPSTLVFYALFVSGVGFLLPGFVVGHRQKYLQYECQSGFPDVMDLLMVCTEAGMSPRAAIDRVSRETMHSYPYLGANLHLMSLELRAGRPLVDAVMNLSRRVEVPEVASLGSLLQQTEQLGTSITDALRIYAEEMRDKRLSRAEEKAHALPVKLVLPLGLYVFPVMMIVIMLPVIVRIRTVFF